MLPKRAPRVTMGFPKEIVSIYWATRKVGLRVDRIASWNKMGNQHHKPKKVLSSGLGGT